MVKKEVACIPHLNGYNISNSQIEYDPVEVIKSFSLGKKRKVETTKVNRYIGPFGDQLLR